MSSSASDDHAGGHRVHKLAPPGMHVEWQVKLFNRSSGIVTWYTYSSLWQGLIEHSWFMGEDGLDYMPGRSQTYRLDFGAMVQVLTSCSEGTGSRHMLRRAFVPNWSSCSPVIRRDAMMSAVDAAGTATPLASDAWESSQRSARRLRGRSTPYT